MKQAQLIVDVKYSVSCPSCGDGQFGITHLIDKSVGKIDTYGPWYCDQCGDGYKISIMDRDVYIDLVPGEKKRKSIVLLRSGYVLLIVEGMYFDESEIDDHHAYYYNEHTCPTNYMPNVRMVIDLRDYDTDPHGIFEHVKSLPYFDVDDPEARGRLLEAISAAIELND